MNVLLEIWLLFKRRMLETLRQPVWLFVGLITPLLYISLFSPLLRNLSSPPLSTSEVLNSFIPGILALLAFMGGTGTGYIMIGELQTGVLERLRVSPASRFSLLMSTILRNIVAFIAPSILVILCAQLFGFKTHIAGILVMFLLLSLVVATVSAWSGSVGLILKQSSSFAALLAGIELPLTLLSGVLLPISLGPKWLQMLAHVNPLYYAVEASRVLASGTIQSFIVFQAFAIMIPLTCITLLWATSIYHKVIS